MLTASHLVEFCFYRDLLLTGDEDLEFDFDSYVVYNSRIFEVGSTESLPKSLHSLDMELFVRMEDNRLSEQLRRSLEESDIAQADISMKTQFFFLYMSSFCGCYGSSSDSIGVNSGARFDVGNVLDQHDINSGRSSFVVDLYPSSEARNDANNSMVNVVFLFNPLSKAGQRAVGLLPLFQDLLQVKQTLIMVPDLEISEFPLQNFYRFVLPKGNGTWKSTANSFSGANFQQLPRQHTLTVRTDVPESWNVQTYQAMQDIDNLRCSSSGDNACGDPVFSVGDADGSEHSDALDEDEGDLGSGGGELLLLDAPGEVTSVSYLLKNLVVGGQCFENIAGADGRMRQKPPAGLQLVLQQPVTMYSNVSLRDMKQGSDLTCASDHCYKFVETIEQSDTLVMNNLGYYQLPANPGVWMLSLAPGRADSLFSIDGIEGDGMVSDASNGLPIVINSFGDTVKRLFVSKRKGLEHIGLLDDAAGVYDDLPEKSKAKTVQRTQSSGSSNTAAAAAASANMNSMWKSISSIWKQSEGNAKFFTSGAVDALKSGVNTETKEVETPVVVESKQVRVVDDDAERIHVFSLATGHMYERLLRIMMLSVSKRTSMPVKFWLFENYLSPSFKASAELMSITYGFEIGYVTYKWPAWLTPQSEKQRIIWGYKILFLDVLFPKSVKRIIYVDADQVVRADLKQLWNIDMEGKPYGYVPFCTSRNDTLGFQFWRSGFWKDHLRGKPYHISAIYMVDLENFRRHAVGDILRSIYNK